jgi:hypothetical protein
VKTDKPEEQKRPRGRPKKVKEPSKEGLQNYFDKKS